MKSFLMLIACILLTVAASAQQEMTTFRSHLSFEYGGQIPMADMADRFGSNFNLGLQFEVMHTQSNLLFGVKGYYLFGSTVKEDVLGILRTPEGEIIGTDGGPAVVFLRERGFFVGPYVGKLLSLSGKRPHTGIKIQLGVGLLQHTVRIQDDTRSVIQITGDYEKGYDRLSNGLAGYLFLGYQHLDPDGRINFLAGFDLTYGATENRRDYDFSLMQKLAQKRTDVLVGFRVGWILPVTTGVPPETIYY